MQCIGGTWHRFVRAGAVDAAHEDIAEHKRVETVLDERQGQLKARICLQPA